MRADGTSRRRASTAAVVGGILLVVGVTGMTQIAGALSTGTATVARSQQPDQTSNTFARTSAAKPKTRSSSALAPRSSQAAPAKAGSRPRMVPHATGTLRPVPSTARAAAPARTPSQSRTSTPVVCKNQDGFTVSGASFEGIGAPKPAITIDHCRNVVISHNFFNEVSEPIFVKDSVNIVIEYNTYNEISGPHGRTGIHAGNFTQWENSFGGRISNNSGRGGDTEDIISIYRSGGSSAESPLLIEDNRFVGTDWSSASGSGIMLGDGGGSHVRVRRNVLVNPGQVGIGVSGGTDITVESNLVYGVKRAKSNVGIYVWAQGGVTCGRIAVQRNRIQWQRQDGVINAYWNANNCGPVKGEATNVWNATVDPAELR